jgi:DNA-directed RNA polymerase subunit beta'
VNVGEAIGVIAAQSIGEPGHAAHDADLPHRRRGIADRGAEPRRGEVGRHGAFHADDALSVEREGRQVAISRSGESSSTDDNSRERERPQGAVAGDLLLASDGGHGARGQAGSPSGTPHHRPIITEYAGTVKFEHVREGATVAEADRRRHRPARPWCHRRQAAHYRCQQGAASVGQAVNEAGDE